MALNEKEKQQVKKIILNFMDLHDDIEKSDSFIKNLFGKTTKGILAVRLRNYIFLADGYYIYKNNKRLTNLDYTYSTKYGVYEKDIQKIIKEELLKDSYLEKTKTFWEAHKTRGAFVEPSSFRNLYFLKEDAPQIQKKESQALEKINNKLKNKTNREVRNHVKDILDNNNIPFDGNINLKKINWEDQF